MGLPRELPKPAPVEPPPLSPAENFVAHCIAAPFVVFGALVAAVLCLAIIGIPLALFFGIVGILLAIPGHFTGGLFAILGVLWILDRSKE